MVDYDAVVIGGGAAGLMFAQVAGHRGQRVLVIERADRIGKKILMSGGGRCNFTNRDVRPEHYLSANPHFCKSALARYRPEDFIALVDRHGIRWHEKELGQLFCDESAKLIVRMLVDECTDAGVRVAAGCDVKSVKAGEGGYRVEMSTGTVRALRLVVASGGLSVPTLGGSGFGYELARQFGHAVLPTRAALVALTLSGRPREDYGALSGLALDVETRAGRAEFRNRMLITHRGISGPAILQISTYWRPGQPLQIDLFPDGDAEGWLGQRQRERGDAGLHTVLAERLPRRFAETFCDRLFDRRPLRQYEPTQRKAVAAALHAWPVTPSGTEGYRTAEVTLGGVATDEISSATMESRLAPGLYFIGEVLDVTGWLGGYNFQWAWASAVAAAQAV
ncbi:MAG TPA: NAD(P)/FAD-dependent oxidoreductase [Nevskiaceae bacterium]|nr:NAD(P)/FAD-dependent oxidoreductase [Nevskiaceae bacterium]